MSEVTIAPASHPMAPGAAEADGVTCADCGVEPRGRDELVLWSFQRLGSRVHWRCPQCVRASIAAIETLTDR